MGKDDKMSKRDFVKERCDRAIAAFKDHELVDNREDRWRICKRESDGKLTSVHAAEIVSLWGGRLYVGGDIDDCVFAYYSDMNDHRAKLEWMGKCNDVGYYVRQKASIGLSDGGRLVDEYDAKVALDDLAWHRQDALECAELSTEVFQDIFTHASTLVCEAEELHAYLREALPDEWEWTGGVGYVVSYRVVYAWAAVRRLCELLDEKDAHAV